MRQCLAVNILSQVIKVFFCSHFLSSYFIQIYNFANIGGLLDLVGFLFVIQQVTNHMWFTFRMRSWTKFSLTNIWLKSNVCQNRRSNFWIEFVFKFIAVFFNKKVFFGLYVFLLRFDFLKSIVPFLVKIQRGGFIVKIGLCVVCQYKALAD